MMIKSNVTLKITTLFVTVALLLASCEKEEVTPDPQPNNPAPATSSFKWQINNGQVVTADSAYAYAQSFVLFAIKNSGANVQVNLSSMATGSYNISSSTGNQLTYSDASNEYEAAGTFIISASSSTQMSGHFNCTFPGSSLSTITGTFSDVPKR
jgi:hypothetical protein